MRVEYADLSLIGDREENQDRVQVLEGERAVLLLAIDGMGGHSDGAKAAQLATESFREAFGRITQPVFDPIGFLHLAIGRAHLRLVTLGARLSLESRPRATCALCLVQDDAAYFAHVGDSRIYLLRDGQVRQLTEDHSLVNEMVRAGSISPEEAQRSRYRNVITRAVGGLDELALDSVRVEIVGGDRMLLCSDGLYKELNEAEICERLAQGNCTEACTLLIETALERGSRDNVTVIVVDFLEAG